MSIKVGQLKKVIRECVEQLREEFEHIEAKKAGSLVSQKPKAVPTVDSGDKKMGPVVGQPPLAVKTTVTKVKEQKAAVNEAKQPEQKKETVKEAAETKEPVVQAVEPKKEQKQMKKEAVRPIEDKKPVKEATGCLCEKCGAEVKPLKQDVSVEVPLPEESANAQVSAEVKKDEQTGEQVAELVIIDDTVTPQVVDNQMIEIQIPEQALRGEGEQGREVEREPMGDVGRVPELPAPQGDDRVEVPEDDKEEGEDQFDRFEDLAGLKK